VGGNSRPPPFYKKGKGGKTKMSKKMKVMISVLVAILVFAIGGTTMVLAQDDEEPEEDEPIEAGLPAFASSELFSSVAEKLGITEDELMAAIQEAREEISEETFTDYLYQLLDRAVEEELISEPEAQEIRDWWADRPEALTPEMLERAFRASTPRLGLRLDDEGNGFPRIKRFLRQRFGNESTQQGASQNGINGQGLLERERAFQALRSRAQIAGTEPGLGQRMQRLSND
jgi:flagellar basal body-associated protein FliL